MVNIKQTKWNLEKDTSKYFKLMHFQFFEDYMKEEANPTAYK